MNIYLFVSGLFLVGLSVVHAVFGEINIFSTFSQSNLDSVIKTSVYVTLASNFLCAAYIRGGAALYLLQTEI
jgi:hypothetical protein